MKNLIHRLYGDVVLTVLDPLQTITKAPATAMRAAAVLAGVVLLVAIVAVAL